MGAMYNPLLGLAIVPTSEEDRKRQLEVIEAHKKAYESLIKDIEKKERAERIKKHLIPKIKQEEETPRQKLIKKIKKDCLRFILKHGTFCVLMLILTIIFYKLP